MSEGDFPTLTAPGVEPKIHSIFDFTDEALNQLRLWLEMHPPALPITSVLGFQQFTAQIARVLTGETTISTTFADLATAGPTLSGLGPGKYIILVSAFMLNNTSGQTAVMSPSVNGAGTSDEVGALITASAVNLPQATVIGMSLHDLALANNEIKAKYRVTGGTGSFTYRNLLALKYANL